MTSSLDPETPWTRFATRFAHWHPLYELAILVVLVAGLFTQAAFPLLLLVLLAEFAGNTIAHRHHHRLCSRCAAKTPLDPAAAVKRHRRALRYVHRNPKRVLAVYAGATLIVLISYFWPSPATGLASLLVLISFFVDCSASSYTMLRHRPLQPWCPWCQRRWRRDDEDIPAPQPVPTGEATR